MENRNRRKARSRSGRACSSIPAVHFPFLWLVLVTSLERTTVCSWVTVTKRRNHHRLSSSGSPRCHCIWKANTLNLRGKIKRQCLLARSRNSDDGNSKGDAVSGASTSSMQTALCIVPPENAWDHLNRARHVARDVSETVWPPCIRLFHPFCPRQDLHDNALKVASVVEKYNIEPFTVTMDQWTILPHAEAIEADWQAMKELPTMDGRTDSNEPPVTETELLIAREELLGKKRKQARRKRRLDKERKERQTASFEEGQEISSSINTTDQNVLDEEFEEHNEIEKEFSSYRFLWEKQKRMYEEFNGPCVVCLEPDQTSRDRLEELRDILKNELFQNYDKYSPSSSVPGSDGGLPQTVLNGNSDDEDSLYRPVIPIGNFPTVNAGIEMAQKLKSLWSPLSFNVSDLQFVSRGSSGEKSQFASLDDAQHSQDQFGCDALVMLVGEEMRIDSEWDDKVVELLCKTGHEGGYESKKQGEQQQDSARRKSSRQSPIRSSDDDFIQEDMDISEELKEHLQLERSQQESSRHSSFRNRNNDLGLDDDDMSKMDDWLNGIDEDDELFDGDEGGIGISSEGQDQGTVVVIGRTHMFTGENRNYVGMPALTVMSGYRSLYSNQEAVSKKDSERQLLEWSSRVSAAQGEDRDPFLNRDEIL